MKPRLDPFVASPRSMKAMLTLDAALKNADIDEVLRHLVKIRASQINGCAYCIRMHVLESRNDGIDEDRMHLLPAWRDSPLYTAREKAALGWTEALTSVAETHAPDEIFSEIRLHFSDKEIVDLTLLIGMINAWNRVAVGFRSLHPS